MIPVYDVEPVINVDECHLKTLTPYRVINGFAMVRDYDPLIDISWDDARECVTAEARWIQAASTAEDFSEFDTTLSNAPKQEAGDDFDWLFRGAEVGAAGLVFTLSAAGYATCTSCRGHVGLTRERTPQIGLATEPDRLRVLVNYVKRVGCGLETDGDGLVWVYARSIADLHELARIMLDERATFDGLAPPPWRSRALDALEHGEDFDWNEDEIH